MLFKNKAFKKKPKVLMVLGSLPPMKCGVGDSMVMLSQHIQNLGINTNILTSCQADAVPDVDTFRYMDSWSIWNLKKFLRKVREIKPDIVHIQYPSLGYGIGLLPYFIPLILIFEKIHVIQTWHEPPIKSPFSTSIAQSLKRMLFSLRYIPNILSKDTLIEVQKGALKELRPIYKIFLRLKNIEYIPVASNIPKSKCLLNDVVELRRRYLDDNDHRKLVAYFGFPFPHKGIEQIFDIASPDKHFVLLIATFDQANRYHQTIIEHLKKLENWKNNYAITGFLKETEVADLLYTSDVVLLPFRTEVTPRNGSFLAARLQGTAIITTSKEKNGFDEKSNVYYCKPSDVESQRDKLYDISLSAPIKKPLNTFGWEEIAGDHVNLYEKLFEN